MQREIKFRGLRTDGSNEWVTGNLFVPNKFIKSVYICPDTTYCDLTPGFEDGDDFEEAIKDGCALGHFYQVIPETVGQFLNVTDKNGLEIFEDTILKSDNDQVGVVGISKSTYGIFSNNFTSFNPFSNMNLDYWEVVGNIHQK